MAIILNPAYGQELKAEDGNIEIVYIKWIY